MSYPSDYVKIRQSTFYSDFVKNDLKILSIGDIHLSKSEYISVSNISKR